MKITEADTTAACEDAGEKGAATGENCCTAKIAADANPLNWRETWCSALLREQWGGGGGGGEGCEGIDTDFWHHIWNILWFEVTKGEEGGKGQPGQALHFFSLQPIVGSLSPPLSHTPSCPV
jgi:hypothetical protein